MSAKLKFPGWFLVASSVLAGCAHAPVKEVQYEKSPSFYFESICGIGEGIKKATGSVWLKATSPDASGQFPADIVVNAGGIDQPGNLRLEAHNLLGATVGVITAEGNVFKVEMPGHPEKTQKGTGSWGGIPLEWASDLFLGKVPCPPQSDLRFSWSPEGKLVVDAAPSLGNEAQRFVYSFKMINKKAWPEELHWERTGFAPLAVDFKFSHPEENTLSPLRWEAKSSLGEIKARWKNRQHE
jgi:hypothetical protein